MPRADWCQARAAPSGESEAACSLAQGNLVMASSLNRPFEPARAGGVMTSLVPRRRSRS